jgi:hypothetical protein
MSYIGYKPDVPGDETVSTAKLVDGAVTAVKIAADAVDGTKIADANITTALIADDAVTNAKMADDAIGVAQLSATGTPSASVVLKGDNSWGTIEGSEITTVGTTFSNYNTISGNTTMTTSSTKNMFLMGMISVNDTYTWTIAGDGVLQII